MDHTRLHHSDFRLAKHQSLHRKYWNTHYFNNVFKAPFCRHSIYVHVVLNDGLISSKTLLSFQTKWRSFNWLPSSSLWSLAVCHSDSPVCRRSPNRHMLILSTDMFWWGASTQPLKMHGQSELNYYKSTLSVERTSNCCLITIYLNHYLLHYNTRVLSIKR